MALKNKDTAFANYILAVSFKMKAASIRAKNKDYYDSKTDNRSR